jgi:hypothetical protein
MFARSNFELGKKKFEFNFENAVFFWGRQLLLARKAHTNIQPKTKYYPAWLIVYIHHGFYSI